MVHQLGATEQEELFKMLHQAKCPYTCNNHGVFVQLSRVPEDILGQIERHIDFCRSSQREIQRYESLCDVFQSRLAASSNEAVPAHCPVSDAIARRFGPAFGGAANGPASEPTTSRMSSTMRFYLLKKRYSKPTPPFAAVPSDLEREPYVL